ncbi:MAG: CHASE3 domain-containing protein [Beijerinckiaceae bacterium]|nr:CHASE3 domain-containing protein [Beijerinckiaceae bacterium]
MNLTAIRNRSYAFIVLGFGLLALVGLAIPVLLEAQREDQYWVQHTFEVKNRLARITSLLQDMQIGQRGYLISENAARLEAYHAAVGSIGGELDQLETELSDNAEQRARLVELRRLVSGALDTLKRLVETQQSGRRDDVIAEFRTTPPRSMAPTRELIARMDEAENELLKPRQADARSTVMQTQVSVYALLVLIVLLTIVVTRDARRQFLKLRDATTSLNQSVAQERALQEQLQQSQKMEAIGQLAGGIAHDFNNMLAVVLSSLTLFKRRSAKGEDVSHFIDAAIEGANRAAKLTHRLLAYSRQQPLNPQSIDVNRFIADMSELLGRALGEHVRIETVLAGGLWRTYADSSQLENSILNLSINSRDAMTDGGKLTIETANAYLDDTYSQDHPGIQAGQYVMIAVTDEGSGMPPEVAARAFDPFFTTKGVGQGTGLGLSQVHGFVRQSGGHIKIYSEIGHGTTVKIYLPRYLGEAASSAPARHPGLGNAPQGRKDEVILVLEDDSRVRALVVESLTELGYTVLEASSGAAALKMLEHQRVTLLFTDVVMPDMNGRKVAELAVQAHPSLKVVYTTGFSRNAIIHNGVLDSGVNFLAKPFTIEDLANKLRAVLDPK